MNSILQCLMAIKPLLAVFVRTQTANRELSKGITNEFYAKRLEFLLSIFAIRTMALCHRFR
jgi:hypothetical protein